MKRLTTSEQSWPKVTGLWLKCWSLLCERFLFSTNEQGKNPPSDATGTNHHGSMKQNTMSHPKMLVCDGILSHADLNCEAQSVFKEFNKGAAVTWMEHLAGSELEERRELWIYCRLAVTTPAPASSHSAAQNTAD